MKQFLNENFLLNNKTAERLYHEFAAPMPIIDYHNHLPPAQIAGNINFENITQAWLYGDHYKWRAMRTNGVNEKYCTGNASDFEKFSLWAATVPYTMRNPLYHWTHLELQRYFGVTDILNSHTAADIYENCSAQLRQPSHSIHGLLNRFNVKIICTTDDPVDDLAYHQQISKANRGVKVFPAFRPDKAMDVADAQSFNQYLSRLEAASNKSISNFNDYLAALKQRHDYF
jgi:glucuronate isomerase